MKTRSIGLCHVSVILVAAGLFQAQKPMAAQTLESSSDALPLTVLRSAKAAPPNVSEAARQHVAASYGKLPLSFEINRGQSDPKVKFLARGSGYSLFLTSNEAVLALKKASQLSKDVKGGADPGPAVRRSSTPSESMECLRMKLVGASPAARESGVGELPGKANYFIGNDPKKWRTNVATYAKVRYREVYPGVDLVYYGNQGQLESDFVLSAGADPNRIAVNFQGADKLEVDGRGDLLLHIADSSVVLRKPFIYQEVDGVRREIAGGYLIEEGQKVGFRVANYDRSKPLVIDPVLSYSTYLGGSGDDRGNSIAVDSSGNAYVTGYTSSVNFPGTSTSDIQSTNGGGFGNAFVTKINVAGIALVYSTYLGGSGGDAGAGIAVDSSGNAYVTGYTFSTNFPGASTSTIQSTKGGGPDAFVTKINGAGSAIVYSTYLGGNSDDEGNGIAVDSSGNAYVTGYTFSTNFPGTSTSTIQSTYGGGHAEDAFVTKINAAGSALVYSTYLGGSRRDVGTGIAIDSSGNTYVTGYTDSTDLPSASTSTIQSTNGGENAFVTKINAAGSALVYSTYLGGSGGDAGAGIAVDSSGNAYVTGRTSSTNFPGTSTSTIQSIYGGGLENAFVTKINAAGSALVYSTYLSGSGADRGNSIAVDSSGNAYVTGYTTSTNFPGTSTSTIQSAYGGGRDAFATKIDAAGSALVYSTYLGGSGLDFGSGIAVDSSGNAYVAGSTTSTNFPGASTSTIQSAYGGGNSDAFVAKIAAPDSVCMFSLSPTGQSFDTEGGLGSFVVSTSATCSWAATTADTWITILPGNSCRRVGDVVVCPHGKRTVKYVVASNSGGPRAGSISVGAQTYSITQSGFVGCSYTIGPTFASPSNTGGNISVSVGAPSGCAWTAISNVSWLTVRSGASGSGGGVVVLNVAPNTGGSRSGTATIAGQTFSVTQGAGACGALDVTSQTSVNRTGLTYIPFSTYLYSGSVTVSNNSGSTIHGPVYLVLIGEPTHYGSPNDSGLIGGGSTTSCYSSPGDYLLLVSGGDLLPGHTAGSPLVWFTQRLGTFIRYSTKVLSGTPSH